MHDFGRWGDEPHAFGTASSGSASSSGSEPPTGAHDREQAEHGDEEQNQRQAVATPWTAPIGIATKEHRRSWAAVDGQGGT